MAARHRDPHHSVYTNDGEIGRLLTNSLELANRDPSQLLAELETISPGEVWYDMAHFLLWYPSHRPVLLWILTERLDDVESNRLLTEVVRADTPVALYPSDFGPLPNHPDVHRAVYRTGDQKGWQMLMREHRQTGSEESPEHLRQWIYLWPEGDLQKEMMDCLIKSGEIRFVGSWEDMFLSLVKLPLRRLAFDGTLYAYTLQPINHNDLFAQMAREDRFLRDACMTRS